MKYRFFRTIEQPNWISRFVNESFCCINGYRPSTDNSWYWPNLYYFPIILLIYYYQLYHARTEQQQQCKRWFHNSTPAQTIFWCSFCTRKQIKLSVFALLALVAWIMIFLSYDECPQEICLTTNFFLASADVTWLFG